MTNQYKVSSGYRFLIEEDTVVKVYFLEGLPFTWDPIEDRPTPSMIHESALHPPLSLETILNYTGYMLAEGMHPLLSDIEFTEDSDIPDAVDNPASQFWDW